ncbi:ubiquitin-like autophagy protein Apg12-domain-containing protein [Dioszegia hungarica]|uniref:Ubiquitin-like protein ATG12 n=1 Tax=Dioszegia hungarica TaxID=4972 RepID=A0AA38LUR0_9TREE|nr:ubiquitin-like autophagy protein Apg12-domain-containing protein [Dioszegia hungarica]KAI9634231.1 ubiquitin-like autophagy protein Apg12-domain-containing protein [Dioszegia hungarica]
MSLSAPIPDVTSPGIGDGQAPGPSLAASMVIRPNAIAALEHYKQKDTSKVVVRFKSIGAAPIMKNNVFKVTAGNKYATVVTFLRGQLGSKEGDPLFTYVNAAFTPAPDDIVGNLYKCFGTEGHLIINYSNTQAWA